MIEARRRDAELPRRRLGDVVEGAIALDPDARRAAQERGEQHRFPSACADVEEAISFMELRRVEGVHDLVVSTRRIGQELGTERRLVERRIGDAEHLLDVVIAIEHRHCVEVRTKLVTPAISGRDLATDRLMAAQRGLAEGVVKHAEGRSLLRGVGARPRHPDHAVDEGSIASVSAVDERSQRVEIH